MYVTTVQQLLTPILQDQINEVEFREIKKNSNEIEVIILAPKSFFKRLLGKNGNVIQAVTVITNVQAAMIGEKVKINLTEL